MWIYSAALLLTLAAPDVQAQALDNSTTAGALLRLEEGELVVATGEQEVALPLEELLSLTPTVDPSAAAEKPSVWIELIDGSRLLATSYRVSQGAAQAALTGGGAAKPSTKQIRAVRFKEQTPKQAEDWKKILAANEQGDLIVIRKDEQIDYLVGIVEDITEDSVHFRLDGELVPVRRGRVEGVVYFHANPPKLPAPLGVATDADGGRYVVADLRFADDQLQVRTNAGLELTIPWSHVKQIDFSAGKIEYLANIAPQSVAWTPYFSPATDDPLLTALHQPRLLQGGNGPQREQLHLRVTNAEGTPEIKQFERGVVLRSRTRASWLLPDEFRTLKALVGIDARFRTLGNVELVIEGDGRELFRAAIDGEDEPLPLEVDIQGIRRLTILVDYGDNLDLGDHLNLCNARIVK